MTTTIAIAADCAVALRNGARQGIMAATEERRRRFNERPGRRAIMAANDERQRLTEIEWRRRIMSPQAHRLEVERRRLAEIEWRSRGVPPPILVAIADAITAGDEDRRLEAERLATV
eukprot:2017509-Heterocapsa_arctica.AAC.1